MLGDHRCCRASVATIRRFSPSPGRTDAAERRAASARRYADTVARCARGRAPGQGDGDAEQRHRIVHYPCPSAPMAYIAA